MPTLLLNEMYAKYHPRTAIGKKQRGAFTVYSYKDGTTVSVRTKFEKKLFTDYWHKHHFYSAQGDTELFEPSEGFKVIARRIRPSGPTAAQLAKLIGGRSPIESPLLEFATPNSSRLLVTKFEPNKDLVYSQKGQTPEQLQQILVSAAVQLAKLHANGFAHMHPHARNVLLGANNVRYIDPKELTQVVPPKVEDTKRAIKYLGERNYKLPKLYDNVKYESKEIGVSTSTLFALSDIHTAKSALSYLFPRERRKEVELDFQNHYLQAYERALKQKPLGKKAALVVRRILERS